MKITDHFLSQETFELKETETPGVFKTYPVPENLDKYYESEEYISHHQDSDNFKQKLYKFLQKFNLNYKRNIISKKLFLNASVLDYGCGAGDFIAFCEEYFITYGLEPNESARNAALQKAKNTTFYSSLSEIEDHSLNAITLWHVFEHIENQEDILNHFYNKLKANGLLIIAVPNSASYDALRYKEFWAAYDVPRHIYHFTSAGMKILMNSEKWKIIKIKPLLLDSYYISMLSEKYKKSPLFWLKGMFFGTVSNIKASKSGEFSSLIYIIEKK